MNLIKWWMVRQARLAEPKPCGTVLLKAEQRLWRASAWERVALAALFAAVSVWAYR